VKRNPTPFGENRELYHFCSSCDENLVEFQGGECDDCLDVEVLDDEEQQFMSENGIKEWDDESDEFEYDAEEI
jgi:hypothetical protein